MSLLNDVLLSKKTSINPIWIMRQAGRYHDHYQSLKKDYTFEDLCKTPKLSAGSKNNLKSKLEGFFKSKLGKSSVQGEEILGVELSNKEIRLAQISSNKATK